MPQHQKTVIIYLSYSYFEDVFLFKGLRNIVRTITASARCVIVAASKNQKPSAVLEEAKRLASKLQEEQLPVMPLAAHYLGEFHQAGETFVVSSPSIEKIFRMGACPIIAPVVRTALDTINYDAVKLASLLASQIPESSLFFWEHNLEEKIIVSSIFPSAQQGSIKELETHIKQFLCL